MHTDIWTTKDGRKVRVCDMTDDHIAAVIRDMEQETARRIALAREAGIAEHQPTPGQLFLMYAVMCAEQFQRTKPQ